MLVNSKPDIMAPRTSTITVSPAHQRYGVVHGGCPSPLGLGTGQPVFGTSAAQTDAQACIPCLGETLSEPNPNQPPEG